MARFLIEALAHGKNIAYWPPRGSEGDLYRVLPPQDWVAEIINVD